MGWKEKKFSLKYDKFKNNKERFDIKMGNLKEAITYFKENKGYVRLFKGIKNKYISLGEIKGNVTIAKPTIIEKQALSGLMKKDYSRNSTITINLRKLQQILDESKFEGIQLKELLKEYFKEEIFTQKENLQKYENELQAFWEDILKENENTYLYDYLKKSINNKDELYQNLKKHYNKEKSILKEELLKACRGINNLPEGKIRIPVFASKITSNPHGFDKKTLCGKLFILLLCYTNNTSYPKNSEELSERYYYNNLLVDDVSNMVLCKNIKAFVKLNEHVEYGQNFVEYEEHEGMKAFDKYNEPIYMTLYNLSNISFIQNKKYKQVIVMENPTVFMEVMEKCKIQDFPLICTYGQVRLAGIILLNLLVEGGYKLYYSGDLDPEGIQIADKLKQRYKENLKFLGFNINTYYKNISNIELSSSRLQKLEGIKTKELKKLCSEIKKNRKVAYEEENINEIINFIEENFSDL